MGGVEDLLVEQMGELQAQHPNLELHRDAGGQLWVRGSIGFCIQHGHGHLQDSYEIALKIPADYPETPPLVFETQGKITRDFEHFMVEGDLCLEAPVEVRRRFATGRTIRRFVDEQVIPYLFSFSYKSAYGRLPYGDRHHGMYGILQYYKEFFSTPAAEALALLKLLADGSAPPLMMCPCGSRRRVRECHGKKLDELRPLLPREVFEDELCDMIKLAESNGIALPEARVMPKKMWRKRRRALGRLTRRGRGT